MRKAFEKAKDVNIYSGKSAYEPIQTSGGVVRYLKINKVFDNKRRILYELMHEMGHLFDPIPKDRNIDWNGCNSKLRAALFIGHRYWPLCIDEDIRHRFDFPA